MTPRSKWPKDFYDEQEEIAALRARITELEAREEAEATKIWQQAQRIAELEAQVTALRAELGR